MILKRFRQLPELGLMNSIHPAMQKSPLSAALRRGMIPPISL